MLLYALLVVSVFLFLGTNKVDNLSPKSARCIFLGYGTNKKGYHCLDIKTERIYSSRHVQFNEDVFPFAGMLLTGSLQPPTSPESWITPIAPTSSWGGLLFPNFSLPINPTPT